MVKIPDKITKLLLSQGYVVVSTLDKEGSIHCSAKGVADVFGLKGKVYLIDLYKRVTYLNLLKEPTLSITAIDENQFIGFTLKGKAKIVKKEKIRDESIKKWERKIIERISKRVIRDVKKDKISARHPESKLPSFEYLIEMEVFQIIDLTPPALKK